MITHLRTTLRLLKPLLAFTLTALIVLSGFRVLYAILYYQRVDNAIDWITFFGLGVRADLIQVGYFIAIPLLLLLPLIPVMRKPRIQYLWWRITVLWLALCIAILWFMEISTPAFVAQYDVRPNRLFFEYLAYPAEVFSTLLHGFIGWLATVVVSTALIGYLIYTFARHTLTTFQPHLIRRRYLLTVYPLLLLASFISIRSTLAHRPANPAFFAVSADAMVNSLILNSTYTLEYALYNLRHEAKANRVYGDLSDRDVIREVLQTDYLKGYQYSDSNYPTVHFQNATVQRPEPLNIVIILEESLGATFVGSLGGQPLTPNLEQLKHQGWWFEQLYATGIRSVRGIEAVLSGFPPSRARSTVKLSGAQRDFFTLADVLAKQGYRTEFIYGGKAHFDNMANFFVGNGFQHIIDEDDYTDPKFVGSWGVSDEDLFARLHQHLDQQPSTQRSFTLVFTSSNHEPFEFPDNAIKLAEQPKNTVANAVKYADHALGQFFTQAMHSEYWQNTLFLVVADHDTRVYGDELIPLQKFHIPGLILGADLTPKKISAVASQIDLAPTLLSLAGVSANIPTVGQDLSNSSQAPANRAMMQFGDNYGWLENNQLTVLRVDQLPQRLQYRPADKVLKPVRSRPTSEQLRKITAFAMLPSVLYENRWYNVP